MSTWRPCKDCNFTILPQKISKECVDYGTHLCLLETLMISYGFGYFMEIVIKMRI